jgi:hypothetical protein
MDAATLYMLVICTNSALCYPVGTASDAPCGKGFCYRSEPSLFTMTKAECEAIIEHRLRRNRPDAHSLVCLTEDEWTRRYPERPDKPIKPIAH